MTITTNFYVAQMDCPTEERIIRNGLRALGGVAQLDFDLLQRRLAVTHTPGREDAIEAAIARLGMDPVRVDGAATPAPTSADLAGRLREWGPLALSGIAALAAEIVTWRTGVDDSSAVIGLALASIVLGGRATLRKGWAALRTRTLNINLLMAIAVIGAALIGHWPEAAMVIFLFALAEKIEGYSLDRARNAIRSLMSLAPEVAQVRDATGTWRAMAAAEVTVGQLLRVRPGERIPLDGMVRLGSSAVDQSPITGESLPVDKSPGDPVFAGTINAHGVLEIEVTARQGETTLARISRSIQEAQAQRAPTQRFVDQFARYYTPGVVILAVLIATVPPLVWQTPLYDAVYKALVLLVVACPCALVLSTPITIVSGLTAAARRGILVKGGAFLEEGRKIRCVALDKTGTLTHGAPVVTDVVPLSGLPVADIVRLAASLNAHSEHPVASAIVKAHTGEAAELVPVTNFRAVVGRGGVGDLDGETYFIGNHRLAEERATCSPEVEATLYRLEAEGKSTVVLGSHREPYAVFGVADTVRPTSIAAVRALHDQGVRTVMLTGDNETTARAIAARVGIDDVRADQLPEDKLAAIGELIERYGAVGMVGDGVNDAPALARASVGFAMGAAGTDTALETADVAIMDDDLRKLPEFLALSRRTARILTENIALAIGIKAVFFLLTLAGQATLWMAVFADMGTSLLVVANGLRLLRSMHSVPE